MSVADELQKLHQLYQAGAINDHELAQAKAKLLSEASEPQPVPLASGGVSGADSEGRERQARQWAFLLHLSVLTGFVVPLAGLIVPIVIWQLKKDELPGIDAHGKNAVNWIISEIIYAAVCGILAFMVVGIPLLIALAVVGVVFPIVAAIKANNGEVWEYPLTITFVK